MLLSKYALKARQYEGARMSPYDRTFCTSFIE